MAGARPLGQAGRSRRSISTPLQALHRRLQDRHLDAPPRCAARARGELVARCIVETGTSSYYTRADGRGRRAGAEGDLPPHRRRRVPPLQAVLHAPEALSGARTDRLVRPLPGRRSARISESEDDELAYAYYAANHPADAPTTASASSAPMLRRAFRLLPPAPCGARRRHGAEGGRPQAQRLAEYWI